MLSQKKYRGQLQNQNGGDSQCEFQMLCFVPEPVHSYQTSHTATDGSYSQQCGFRDPPKFFLGFALVRKHKEVSDGINCKKVKKNQFGHSNSLSGGDRE